MTTLEITPKTILEVDAHNWSEFVCDVYKLSYDKYHVFHDMGVTDGKSVVLHVEKEELEEWDQDDLDEFKKEGAPNHDCCVTQTVATDLCNRGLIEPGEYLITE